MPARRIQYSRASRASLMPPAISLKIASSLSQAPAFWARASSSARASAPAGSSLRARACASKARPRSLRFSAAVRATLRSSVTRPGTSASAAARISSAWMSFSQSPRPS